MGRRNSQNKETRGPHAKSWGVFVDRGGHILPCVVARVHTFDWFSAELDSSGDPWHCFLIKGLAAFQHIIITSFLSPTHDSIVTLDIILSSICTGLVLSVERWSFVIICNDCSEVKCSFLNHMRFHDDTGPMWIGLSCVAPSNFRGMYNVSLFSGITSLLTLDSLQGRSHRLTTRSSKTVAFL